MRVLGIFQQEKNAQDLSCDGPGHLLWCHIPPVRVLGIRKAVLGPGPDPGLVLGPGPGLGPRTAFLMPGTIKDDTLDHN